MPSLKNLPWSALLGLMAILLLQGCETVPADREIVEADTVLVLPADTLHRELERFSGDVQKRMAEAIRKNGFRVVRMKGETWQAIHKEALTVSGAMYEPGIGKMIPLNRSAYTKAIIDLARENTRYDVIVIPELVLRKAQTVGDEAVWDGVEREYSWVKKPKETFTLPQKASGLSLRLDVYTDSGSKLLVNFAGIGLPYDLRYDEGKFLFDLKDVFFTDSELGDSVDMSVKVFKQHVKSDED